MIFHRIIIFILLTITDHGPDYRQLDTDSAATVSARKLIPGSVDVLMGSAVVPLHSLLTHRTGKNHTLFLSSDSAGAVSARKLIPGPDGVLMGTAVAPLPSLLTHRTGKNHYTLFLSSDSAATVSARKLIPGSSVDVLWELLYHCVHNSLAG